MEKASNNNNTKLSKMLQKALSIGHSAAPFSPARDYRHRRTISTANRGFLFSTSITPLLPTTTAKVKRRNKNDVVWAEPTSPKVSCIGQIKLAKEKKNRAHKNLKTTSSSSSEKGSFLKLKRLFTTGRNTLVKSNSTAFAAASEHQIAAVEAVAAPSLGKMKKFASSRESLIGFDWTVETKREETRSKDKEDVTIRWPVNQTEGLSLCPKPKSEVNLWKRRTMDPPKPLQLT